MAQKLFKASRKFFTNSTSEVLTDDNYKELSLGQQILVNVAEYFDIEVRVAEFEGRKFVDRDTLNQIAEAME